MALYGYGKYGIDEYAIAPIPPTPPSPPDEYTFEPNEDRVLGQVTPSQTQIGSVAGPLELGALSIPFAYQDDAGRYLETNSNHTFVQNAVSKTTNIPDSENPETISNVPNRFVR